jgi:hypothetical protein
MARSVENILQGLISKPYEKRDAVDILSEGLEKYKEARKWKDYKLLDQGKSLESLLKVIDSEEGMNLYDKKLAQFKSDSSGFADHTLTAESLGVLGNQKQEMYTNFSTSIQEASSFINSDQFLDTQDEFINLPVTVEALNEKLTSEGKVTHAGTLEFLKSEMDNTSRLMEGIMPGFKYDNSGNIIGSNFRYNKANNSDQQTARKLSEYYQRLDLATKTLAGDGIITSDEAQAIIIGDIKDFKERKETALKQHSSNYTSNKTKIAQYDGYINKAMQGKIKDVDDLSMLQGDMGGNFSGLLNNVSSGDWDAVIEDLKDERAKYKTMMLDANEKYKYWSGDYYEGKLQPNIIGEFDVLSEEEKLIKAQEEEEEEEKRLVETKERYKEPEEKRKAQTYSMGEESDADNLLSGYINGSVSDSVIKNIGGQSLLNRVRVMKNAYKGRKPQATVIPFVKTKGIIPIDIKTLKGTNFKNPGKSGTFSWEDITSEIYSEGKAKTEKGASIAEQYLSDEVDISDLKIRWRGKRKSIETLKNKFKKLGISLKEFKEKYSKDYRTLVNLLAKSRT